MDRQRLDGWCEKGILGLVLAVLIYTPLATGAVRPQDFVIVEWLTVGIITLWGGRFWLNPKHRLLWPPMCWAVLLFMGYAVGRYLTAEIEIVARQEMIRVLIYGFIFFAILNNLHRLETTQVVTVVLIALATVISIYALIQFLTDSELVWHFVKPEAYQKRGSGTFISPNNLAGYLEMLLPLTLAYTLTGRFSHLSKVLLGYASLAIFTGMLVTVSRGGWAATALSLAVLFVWLMRQRDYRLQGLLVITGLIAIMLVFHFTARFSQNRINSLKIGERPNDIRLLLWKPAVQIWNEHFWWGAGPAHFDYRFPQFRPVDKLQDQMQVRPDRVHNDYLNTLVDWGLVGAVVVAAAWGMFYWGVFTSWKFVQRAPNDLASKRSNKSSFVIGGALGLLAILLHSVVDFNMHIPANAILAVTLMALVGGHFRFATEEYWITLHGPLRAVVTVILLAGLFYLGHQSWRRTLETHWLVKAEENQVGSPEYVAAMQKAFAAENRNFETAYNAGEGLRLQSWEGEEGYQNLARAAMEWFRKSMDLNPYDPYSRLRYGMCLHWIGRHDEASPYFQQAYKLDPNSYYTLAHIGWHHVQLEDWATAKIWFEKSRNMNWLSNPIAKTYLEIVEQKLAESPSSK